jgi:4-amino-4-deoxy-L-arabinose transferase-like glycosyltransferase
VRLRLHRPSRWWGTLIAVGLLGLTVRLGYVFIYQYHVHIGGDSFYYHYAANLLATGHGFIFPYDFYFSHVTVQAAEHPPLYIVLLAGESWIGLHTYLEHQIFTCLMDTSTILIIGYTARELFGKGAGIFAAVIVAIYPYFWFNDGGILSEGTAQLTTALTVLFAYRLWERRTVKSACWLGVGIGLATLSRAEAILLPVLMLLPLVLFMKPMQWKRRIQLILAGGLTAAVVLGPWVGYNLSRFDRPVTVSNGFDITLLSANCNDTYYGPRIGYWAFNCVAPVPRTYQDLSDQAVIYQQKAYDYIKSHESRLPLVLIAREGRTWGWWNPPQIPELDSSIETKPLNWGRFGMVMLYSLEIASIFGVLVMRKRKIPLTPLVALIVNVCISTALTFGQTRYRASAEVALVLMATAGFVGLAEIIKRRRQRGRPPQDEAVERGAPDPTAPYPPVDPERATV